MGFGIRRPCGLHCFGDIYGDRRRSGTFWNQGSWRFSSSTTVSGVELRI